MNATETEVLCQKWGRRESSGEVFPAGYSLHRDHEALKAFVRLRAIRNPEYVPSGEPYAPHPEDLDSIDRNTLPHLSLGIIVPEGVSQAPRAVMIN